MGDHRSSSETTDPALGGDTPPTTCGGDSQPENAKNKIIFRVHQYDPSTEGTRKFRIVDIGDSKPLGDQNLGSIRKLLNTNNVFSGLGAGFSSDSFCDVDGSEVSDDMALSTYLQNVKQTNEEAKKAGVYAAGTEIKVADIYFKRRRIHGQMDQATKESLGSAGALSHPADLTEHDWSVILRTNSIFNGHQMVEYEKFILSAKDPNGKMEPALRVERSPYSAFKLKARHLDPQEIAAPSNTAAKGAAKEEYLIPRFTVNDHSYVRVFETKTSLQHSMADNAFSEDSVQASAAGSFWGVSADISGGFAQKDSKDSVDVSASEGNKMNVSYNFPRVTLFLNPSCLEITEECENDLDNLSDSESCKRFLKKYGSIFSQKVHLGGRLSCSDYSECVSGDSITQKQHALKRSAAASISSSFARMSVSGGLQNGASSSGEDSNNSLNHEMAWEAKGGDTTLCNNPAAWCSTVRSFYNWRVIEQSNVVPIYEVFSHFDRYKDVAKKFQTVTPRTTKTIAFKLITELGDQPLTFWDSLCSDFVTHLLCNLSAKIPECKGDGDPTIEDRTAIETAQMCTSILIDRRKDTEEHESFLKTDVPVGNGREGTIYHHETTDDEVSIESWAGCNSLSYIPSLLPKHCEGDCLPYYLATQGKKVRFFFQTPGETKKSGPVGPNDSVEVGVVDAATGEFLGLLTKNPVGDTNQKNGFIGIEKYERSNKSRAMTFKVEVLGDQVLM